MKKDICIALIAKEGICNAAVDTIVTNIDIIERFGLRIDRIETDQIPAVKEADYFDGFQWQNVEQDGSSVLIRIYYRGKKKDVERAEKYIRERMTAISIL